MRDERLDGYVESRSRHYCYYCKPDSLAAREMPMIMHTQEESYAKIVSFLGVEPGFFIRYILCETSGEVGQAYGDNEPCNGFAALPDTVFAVYSNRVRCIGPHEDTHLIAALIARPDSVFIREGLAMLMDEKWWGKPNTVWVKEFLLSGQHISIEKLFDNEYFWSCPEEMTYPVAGAFTLWLVEKMGNRGYLDQVYITGTQARSAVEKAFDLTMTQVEQQFCNWILQQTEAYSKTDGGSLFWSMK